MKMRRGPQASHTNDYKRLADGSVLCGKGCFSGPYLKRRFASSKSVDAFLTRSPQKNMQAYKCTSCEGWHLTTR